MNSQGDSHKKGWGCPLEILRTPKRYQDPVLWAWLVFLLLFSPLSGTFSPIIFFWFNTPQRSRKAPALHLLGLNILRGTKTAFSSPKRNDNHQRPVQLGVFPSPCSPPPAPPPPTHRPGNRFCCRVLELTMHQCLKQGFNWSIVPTHPIPVKHFQLYYSYWLFQTFAKP